MNYLADRLREPGTLRSLAVIVMAALGYDADAATLELVARAFLGALGLISALMPEKAAVVVTPTVNLNRAA